MLFDFDYEMDMPPMVTPAALDHLHQEWKRSRPIENECDRAYELIMTEPQIYIKLPSLVVDIAGTSNGVLAALPVVRLIHLPSASL